MENDQFYWKFALTFAFVIATIFIAVHSGAVEALEETFNRIGWFELLVIFGLFGIMRMLQALSLVRAIELVDGSLRFRESLDLAGLKGLYNLGLGGAGIVAQAVHARSRKLFSISTLAFATISQTMLLVSALGTLLLLFSTGLLRYPAVFWPLFAFGILAAVVPFLALHSQRHARTLLSRVPRRLRFQFENLGDSLPTPQFGQLFVLWLLQTSLVVFRLSRILAIALFLDPLTPLGHLAVVTLFADLVTVVPLTPGGIGMREFFIGLGSSLGGQSELYITAAIIDRGITIVGNFIHGTAILAKQPSHRST